ncbi:MAG TPA: YdeI/OmpD-associated family protein [Pyrinomonadaceae bacterium]|nr:YdeI/OmpD-associated family protein [Pyrinomonadaceae bacterium]
MNKTNPKIDTYLTIGCGRCPLGNTPECKVHNWTEELETLREIVLDCGLTEELKWSVPCYTFEGNNIAIVSAFKEFCSISFFKGVLLKDTDGILSKQGENSNAARIVKFTDTSQIVEKESILKAYINEAVEVEKAGLKVEFKDVSEYEIPVELQRKLEENEAFRNAFNALTPGRKKGYILHFSQPKQSKTREARIEKSMPRIFLGKGLNDY